MNRRQFIQAGGILVAGAAAPALVKNTSAQEPTGTIRKAVGWGMIDRSLTVEDRFRLAKDVGFAGIEVTRHTKEEATEPQALARAS